MRFEQIDPVIAAHVGVREENQHGLVGQLGDHAWAEVRLDGGPIVDHAVTIRRLDGPTDVGDAPALVPSRPHR